MNNLKEMKKKELFLAIFAGAIALFSFLAFTFHAFRMTEDTELALSLAGYGSLGSYANTNPFGLIEHLGDWTGVYKTYAIFDLLALGVSLACIAFFVFALLKQNAEERLETFKKIIAATIVISLFMLVQGIHLNAKTNDDFWLGVEMGGTDPDQLKAMGDFGFETEAYWPLILTVALTVGYELVLKKMPEDGTVAVAPVETVNTAQEIAPIETASTEAPVEETATEEVAVEHSNSQEE
ncbi:MAG: hypothetical protein IJY05_00010 [Clostridia bacterium]|nr:hypothetical protein [Clostridia bacterium]